MISSVPVLVATTFRTPDEAVALANNTRYGLSASVWTENVNRALEIAARVKVGVVWINSTNLFDAAAGFGGYRESGFGREGGREGLAEYLVAEGEKLKGKPPAKATPSHDADSSPRPDPRAGRATGWESTAPRSSTSAASRRAPIRVIATPCSITRRLPFGLAGLGNRKDIRNAVEAAAKASGAGARRPRTTARKCSITSRENLEGARQ